HLQLDLLRLGSRHFDGCAVVGQLVRDLAVLELLGDLRGIVGGELAEGDDYFWLLREQQQYFDDGDRRDGGADDRDLLDAREAQEQRPQRREDGANTIHLRRPYFPMSSARWAIALTALNTVTFAS